MIRSMILGCLVAMLGLAAACGSTTCKDACTHWRVDCLSKNNQDLQSCVDNCNLQPDSDTKTKNIDCWATTSCADIQKNPSAACGAIGPLLTNP